MTIFKSARFFSVALLLAVSSQTTLQAQAFNPQAFTLHPNGVTVLCPTAAIGDYGTVNGRYYYKRTAEQIRAEPWLAEYSCTSGITDMSYLFLNSRFFNLDISHWDVSHVEGMIGMFSGAFAFNHDLSFWDVSRVVDMSSMFENAFAFNQDLSGWCVSGIAEPSDFNTNGILNPAFYPVWGTCNGFTMMNGITVVCPAAAFGATDDVRGVVYTKRTKEQITTANAATTCTSGITDMSGLFVSKATFNADLSSWDVSNVTSMYAMFIGAEAFNGDISTWDVSKVTNMAYMFHGTHAFNQNLNSWDVSAVTDMGAMFKGATAFNGNIARWDVRRVTNMDYMFDRANSFNRNIGGWCVSSIAEAPTDFNTARNPNPDKIPAWGTCPPAFRKLSNGVTVVCHSAQLYDSGTVDGVTYIKRPSLYIKIYSGLSCTSDITDMGLGQIAYAQRSDPWPNITHWDVSDVTNMSNLLDGATDFNQDLSAWDVSNVTNMRFMFSQADAFNGDISTWDVSNVTNMDYMFFQTRAFNQDLSGWCVSRFANAPTVFKTWGFLSQANTPVWGTCPSVDPVISGDAGWRLLSFPITGGKISDISDDTPIQGISGGANPTAAANVYLYDDSDVFETPTDMSTPFGDGKGFAVAFFNNANAGSSVLPVTLDAAGAPPSGDVTVTLNPSPYGYTLVGNPFASNFLASAANLVFAGVGALQNNIHFWNDGAGSYSVQDRTAYIIRPWQGFWVQRGASGGVSTLAFKTIGKTTSNATGAFFSKELAKAANRADLRFTLTSGRSYDEAIRLSLRDDATTAYDVDDAGKLLPLLPAYAILGFRSNDMLKSVESLPWGLTESLTIPMEQTLVGVDGRFALAWSGMESFPAGWDLTLHDYQTGVDTDMRADTSYTFDATAPAAKVSPLTLLDQLAPTLQKPAAAGTRFAITVNPNTGVVSTETDNTPLEFSLDQNYPNPFNPSTTIGYTMREAGPVSLSIYTMTGQVVATLVNESQAAGQHRHSWEARGFASGVYYYRLRANGMDVTRKMTLIK